MKQLTYHLTQYQILQVRKIVLRQDLQKSMFLIFLKTNWSWYNMSIWICCLYRFFPNSAETRKAKFFLLFVNVWHIWSFFLLVKEKLPWCFTEGFCFFGWYIMLFGVKPKFFLTSGQGYWAILESESFLFTIHWWYCFQMKVFCWHAFENICRCCLDT